MSLTVARSERVRSVLTHASLTRIYFNSCSARVSNILSFFLEFMLIVNKFAVGIYNESD